MEHYSWLSIATAGLCTLFWFLGNKKGKNNIVPTPKEAPHEPEFRTSRPKPQRKEQVVEQADTVVEQPAPVVEQVVESAAPLPTTRELLFTVLRNLKLEYKSDPDEDIMFTYQGEHFEIWAQDESKFIEIRYLWWFDAPLDDIDNLSIIHKAVNECNIYGKDRIVYNYLTDENTINLHTFSYFLWIPQIPEIEKYFKCMLEDAMKSQRLFFQTMEKIRREQYANANN